MKLKNKKQAYTLAEIMLVILILSIIFAAMAPIFTKRKITQYTGKYNVWSYSDRVNLDAFYDPGDPSATGQLFFGVTPSDSSAISSTLAPLSKIVIRAGEVTSDKKLQRHIQFRFGRTSTNKEGDFAGSWYVNRKNVLMGGRYVSLSSNEGSGARDNVALGYEALTSLNTGKNNVAVGLNALSKLDRGQNNVAVGYNAGVGIIDNSKNVFVGYQAGTANTSESVAIGYRAGLGVTGINNMFVGAFSGGGATTSSKSGGTNTAVGYNALTNLTTGTQNIAIGYNALKELTTGSNNVAIGYNACSYLTTQSNKTCIGYNSGPKPNNDNSKQKLKTGTYGASNSGSAFLLWDSNNNPIADNVERVYIGGTPKNFGGDAILEIHNPSTTSTDLVSSTDSRSGGNTTTVINGNLIVRGRPYFTIGNKLHHFHNHLQTTESTNDTSRFNRWYGYSGKTSNCGTFCDNGRYVAYSDNLQDYELVAGFPGLKAADSSSSSSGSSSSGSSSSGNTSLGGGGGGGGDCLDFDKNISNDSDKNHYLIQDNRFCSDRRLKNIGERFNGGLNEINKLKVYNFTFKNDAKKVPQIGVLAQELQKVFPTAVFEDENGYLKIRWDEMFYATINAIKELDNKIVALVKRTAKVETKISKLEKENIELKNQIDSLTARVNKLKAQ